MFYLSGLSLSAGKDCSQCLSTTKGGGLYSRFEELPHLVKYLGIFFYESFRFC